MKTICIYHKNCFDGMCAAWVVSKYYSDAEFMPMQYGDSLDWLTQGWNQGIYSQKDNLIVVDFSFQRNIMIAIKEMFPNMIVLDHHKTAQKNCEGLDFCKFDMNESGASLTWKYFNYDGANGEMPNLVKYIADRDLWKFELSDSKEINAYIQSFPMTLEDYNYLYDTLENYNLERAADLGKAIERYKQTMVEAMCKNAVPYNMNGYFIPVINSTLLFSEVGHYMCQQSYFWLGGNKPAFAASFFIRNDSKKQWSLRSIGEFDVSEIARLHGGGGHKNASGFEEDV
jgi:oligoribonuclease NrnB/cAMP/cGMP phosphodiesterase (DHH superfamily)